jgi:hypothetical protein
MGAEWWAIAAEDGHFFRDKNPLRVLLERLPKVDEYLLVTHNANLNVNKHAQGLHVSCKIIDPIDSDWNARAGLLNSDEN